MRRQLGIAHRVLDILMPKVVLKGAGVVSVVGQSRFPPLRYSLISPDGTLNLSTGSPACPVGKRPSPPLVRVDGLGLPDFRREPTQRRASGLAMTPTRHGGS